MYSSSSPNYGGSKFKSKTTVPPQASTKLSISEKQFNWIREMYASKKWQTELTGPQIMTLKIIARAESVEKVAMINSATASHLIDLLLKCSSADGMPSWDDLKAITATLPASKYAVEKDGKPGEYIFYEIKIWKKTGARFLNRLQGAPGGWSRVKINLAEALNAAKKIADDPKAAAFKYCELYTRCCCCDSPLSNEKSLEQAMGPVCSKKFSGF